MDIDFSSLSDQELSEMLKDYGVPVGPINAATRKTYERKLHKLKTGQVAEPSKKYEPVADDEDDQEIQFKPKPPTPKTRSSYVPPTKPAPVVPTPPPTQPRQRKDPADLYSPHVESRPGLASARKTTRSYEPRDVDKTSKRYGEEEKSESGGLPMWVKMVVVFTVIILMYLIYSNMESNIATNVPKIPGKMGV